MSRLNKRADYGYEAGAAKDLTTGEVFTGSDGEEGFTACVGDDDGGSGGDTQREIIFYTLPSLNRPGKQRLQSAGEITKRGYNTGVRNKAGCDKELQRGERGKSE